MDTRRLVFFVVGALMVLVGLFADLIGLGPNPGIGWKQIALVVVGGIVVAAGFVVGGKPETPED